jgi:tripartite-type tricarboxylate transporter receptor subunit TctC
MMIAGVLGVAAAGDGAAQAYPGRPIRMVVPFSAGGATDVPGRLLSQGLAERLGQQVVVDNRPGAGGALGSEIVARAQPDGYTIMLTGTPFAVMPAIYPKLSFDPARDFAPILQVALAPNVLVVHPSLPVRSVKELIALAQAQPGKIQYASGGTGGATHLFVSLFQSMAKVDLMHIPYKGSGPATADLLGGHVKVYMPGIAIALPHSRAGRMIPLGVSTARRVPQMPEVPTISEAGVPGYDTAVWFGLFAPRATPPAVVARLQDEAARVVRSSEVEGALVASGYVAATMGAADFGKFVRGEIARWGQVVREAKIRPD